MVVCLIIQKKFLVAAVAYVATLVCYWVLLCIDDITHAHWRDRLQSCVWPFTTVVRWNCSHHFLMSYQLRKYIQTAIHCFRPITLCCLSVCTTNINVYTCNSTKLMMAMERDLLTGMMYSMTYAFSNLLPLFVSESFQVYTEPPLANEREQSSSNVTDSESEELGERK